MSRFSLLSWLLLRRRRHRFSRRPELVCRFAHLLLCLLSSNDQSTSRQQQQQQQQRQQLSRQLRRNLMDPAKVTVVFEEN